MYTKLLLAFALLAAVPYAQARDGKFLFVSSSTSTSVTTTTSMLSAFQTCLLMSKTKFTTACQGRRKRSLIKNSVDSDEEIVDISASKATKNAISVPDLQGEAKDDASNREGRFAWYYMTTTLTSVSTSTSTSTTYSSTITISLVACTPSDIWTHCSGGKKK